MKVSKRTTVEIGDGTAQGIIDGLTDCGVPPHAVAVAVDADWSATLVDSLLDSSKFFMPQATMTFAWEDEE